MKFFKWLFRYGVIWTFTCMKCNTKWKSKEGPHGTYLYGEEGQTRCPKCKGPECSGVSYDKHGKFAGGAVYEPEVK